jgi:hypothetical protein
MSPLFFKNLLFFFFSSSSLSSFFFPVCCILQIYTYTHIPSSISSGENVHVREEKERKDLKFYSLSLTVLSSLLSLLLCMCVEKKSERISILPYAYIYLKSV